MAIGDEVDVFSKQELYANREVKQILRLGCQWFDILSGERDLSGTEYNLSNCNATANSAIKGNLAQ